MSTAPGRRRRVQACVPCRSRKVKCDRVKPCHACCVIAKPNECVFTASEDTRTAISQSEEIERLRKQIDELTGEFSGSDTSWDSKAANRSDSSPASKDISPAEFQTSVDITRSLVCVSAYHTAFVERLLAHYAPLELENRSWLHRIAAYVNDETSSLTKIFRALSIAHCGAEDNSKDLQIQAEITYTSALQQLQHDLNSSEQCENPETLYSAMMASLYELLIKENMKSWFSYLDGVGKLMAYRGPNCYSLDLDHDTFRFYRRFALPLSVLRRQPTFLSLPGWISNPWQHGYPSKDLTDLVIDCLLEIPTIQHEVDTLNQNILSGFRSLEWAAMKRQELKSKAAALLDRLSLWQSSWAETYPGTHEASSIHYLSSPIEACTSDFIPFVDLTQSHAVNLNYAGKLMALYLLVELDGHVPLQEAEKFIEYICSHVEQQLLVAKGYFTAMRTLFPLQVASRFPELTESHMERLTWCFQRLFSEFGVKSATWTARDMREAAIHTDATLT